MKGISTVIATLLMLLITIALAGMAYVYIYGAFTAKTRAISLIDAYCVEQNSSASGAAIVKNDGPDVIRASEQTLVDINEACTDTAPVDISMGARAIYNFTSCATATSHSYRLIGPANSIEITFRCA